MISIRDVTVSFGGVIALNQLSVDLQAIRRRHHWT